MKKFCFLACFLAGARLATAAAYTDIEYGNAAGESLRLDAWIPDGAGPHAAVILVHGGGWTTGDKSGGPRKAFMAPMHEPLQSAGLAWFSINYRLAPQHQFPACLDDVLAAIRWVKAHAAEYRIDPNRLALSGESAGGHLVVLAAVRADAASRIAAVIPFYGRFDLVDDLKPGAPLRSNYTALFGGEVFDERAQALMREASPIHFIKSGLPPFLLVHGTADTTVPYEQSTRLQATLREHGVPCDFIRIEGGAHGMLGWEKVAPDYKQQVAAWLAKTLNQPPAPRPLELKILGPDYPRAFFFRASEGQAANPKTSYESWEADFGRLMGVMGKVLDEEVLGREKRNPEFFTRFKRAHPEQVVLLHFNGNARDPRYHTENYSAGHWIYRQATAIIGDVPAETGESTIKVRDAADFQLNTGRYKNANDDVAIFGLTADGKHDWNRCEQVQLVAVDRKAGTIRVRRGCYGTRPLAFKAGTARAAAHQTEGPWGKTNHLMWYYNFATHCPRDAAGKNAADRLVDDLAAWFGPGGKLAAFDGLEFDVMFHETRGDTDGDGTPDHGVISGVNHYGIGMIEFARQLRTRLGPHRIIQGDGALGPGGSRSQRAFGILNGIESEGFPNLHDWAFEDWSGGLNRHAFWAANSHPPAFSYINHKWNESVPGQPGEHRNPEVPFSRHRLAFAGAQFTDAAVCYSFTPARDPDRQTGIWDELRGGTLHRPGWLGRPEGPVVHLAAAAPDLLAGQGRAPAGADLSRRVGGPVTARLTDRGIIVQSSDPAAPRLTFTIRDLPTHGPNLVVLLTAQAEKRAGYPREMARFLECELSGGVLSLMSGSPDQTGIGLRGKPEESLQRETGARVQAQPRTTIGDRTLSAYAIHPPYLGAKGYVFWTRDVDVPAAAELRFSLGLSDRAPGRSDGVWFKVLAAEIAANRAGAFTQLFERSTSAHTWIPCTVPLERFAGRRVRLKFVADCGPKDNATTDQGFWGDVKIVPAGQPETAVTTPARSMSWLNDRTFTSTFYFRDVRSPTVNLTLSLDGPEALTISSLSVHAQPDTMYRVFEHGLVLANPSRRPCTFDPAALTPGRTYRRLPGSPTQDPSTNHGEPVTGPITLGERDALFLLRTK